MKWLSFLVNDEIFAVDVTLVQKIARNIAVTPVPTAPNAVVGIANVKGRVVTVLSLAVLLKRSRDMGSRFDTRVHAVVFKPFTGADDQMALVIDKPGDLVTISENKILPLSWTTGEEEKLYISATAEVDDRLYRIINVESIVNRFRKSGEKNADTMSMGGTGEDEKI